MSWPTTHARRSSSTGGRSGARCGSRAGSSGSTAAESEAYFRTRPLGSRLAAWASPQSRPLADRARAGAPLRGRGRALRRGRAAAAALGRLPARPGRVRVLAARRRPPARPRSLRARRDRLVAVSASRPSRVLKSERAVSCASVSCACQARSTRLPRTSRIPIIPSRCSPSTTGRWRILRSPISRAASRIGTSASTVTGSRVITSPTRTASRSVPSPASASTSRSVKMPTSLPASQTATEPTPSSSIRSTARRAESPGSTITTRVLITSPIAIRPRV